MHNSNTFALSKDIIFGASNHTDINPTFSIPLSLEEISFAKAKESLKKELSLFFNLFSKKKIN